MRKALTFILPVIICFLVGFVAGQLQSDAIENWYPYLNKPSLTPPNAVFPVAWSILYLCMGVSIGFILNSRDMVRRTYLMWLFIVQLIINFFWSIFFFYLQNPLLGLMDIILLDIFILLYIYRSYPVNKISSMLFVPYLLWVGFATYLNLYIYLNN